MTTKLTLENENGIFSIEIPAIEINFDKMTNDLIVPLMLAAGYSPVTIDEVIQHD